MIVQVSKEFGKHLQGKLPGKKHFARLCELVSHLPPSTTVFLDFKRVEIVTGSWINAVFAPFFQWASNENIDLFPVICNLADKTWLDEFALVADWTHRCFLVGSGTPEPEKGIAIGPLDQGQVTTLKAVTQFGPVTGAELERRWEHEPIKATAWNNRLRDLYDKRLIRRERRGREQVYSTVIKEIDCNG